MFQISPTQPEDGPAVEALLDAAFGPTRKSKTSYRFREGVDPVADLSRVVRDNGRIIGSIAYWPVIVGERTVPALLLGPLAVDPTRKNEGIGAALVFGTLDRAVELGHRMVLLVGDLTYYRRFGFSSAVDAGIHMPDESIERLQYRALDRTVLKETSGAVARWPAGSEVASGGLSARTDGGGGANISN